ncbi:hypothetical protein STEG23_031025 [Scotinomys teguina]
MVTVECQGPRQRHGQMALGSESFIIHRCELCNYELYFGADSDITFGLKRDGMNISRKWRMVTMGKTPLGFRR